MSPDVLTLDLEEVSDILFLHVSHTLVSSYILAKIVLRKINSRGALITYFMYYCLDGLVVF